MGGEAVGLGIESLVGLLCAAESGGSPGTFTDSLGDINARVGRVTGGYDLKLLIPLALLFLGVRKLMTSEKVSAPAWYDYLWFAFATFTMMNQWAVARQAEAEREAGGEVCKPPKKK